MADPDVLLELVEVIGRLRRECAWKAGQTHRSLTRYLLEETYEAVEAIEAGDPDRVRDELGDVLLQVYLHAAIAEQAGQFDIGDVAEGLRDKMIRRNPHVFGAETETDPERINARWQQIKREERAGRPDRRDDEGIPAGLPALLRATKVLERRADAGAAMPQPGSSPDGEATDDPAEVIGNRLLMVVEQARRAGVDPEQALREAVRRLADVPNGD